MKLAIASTTILFAMMAAQAAVLSATSTADVNLVKRAPNGDDDAEQSDMAALITKLKQECDGKTSPACTNANTEITKLEKKLASLEVQVEAILEEYETKLHERNDVEKARRFA
ncbi:hypothetical protein BASA60_006688 [Batrachochytrium salamandrivorans]|nr:hypothetical protein BASA60_006688 [Batrachochytrium salamandrivorans]